MSFLSYIEIVDSLHATLLPVHHLTKSEVHTTNFEYYVKNESRKHVRLRIELGAYELWLLLVLLLFLTNAFILIGSNKMK